MKTHRIASRIQAIPCAQWPNPSPDAGPGFYWRRTASAGLASTRLRRWLRLLPAFGITFCFALLQPVPAATITVTSNADSGPGSLREALALAQDGDTIDFAVTGAITLTSGQLVVTQSVTIAGPGPEHLAIDGNQHSRIFTVNAGTTVGISGLTLRNGRGTFGAWFDGGGAIKNHGSLTLSNAIVSGNQSVQYGGGISNWGVLHLLDCLVSGNYAAPAPSGDGPGGGYGGGIYNGGNAWLTRCIVQGNSCYDSGGGVASPGVLEITDSVVSGNLATNTYFKDDGSGNQDVNFGGYGGGFFLYASGVVRIFNSRVGDNQAVFGGGIYSDGGTVEISAGVVSGNFAYDGGGLNSRGPLQITGSEITGNSAELGGGLLNYHTGTPRILNSLVNDNVADQGGGIANFCGLLEIIASTIQGNQSQGQGGGIYNFAADLRVLNSTVAGNSASEGAGLYNGGFFFDPRSLPLQQYTVRVWNSTFSANAASASGGAIFNFASFEDANPYEVVCEILNSTFDDNSAGSGGSLYNALQRAGLGTLRLHIGSTILGAGGSGGNIVNSSATFLSLGYNLSSDDGAGLLTAPGDQINLDPLLGPLQDNGGPTFTHAPHCSSPALDAGLNFSTSLTDQRDTGFARTLDDPGLANALGGDGTDIGAVELQSACGQPVTLVSIAITPANALIPAGLTQQFTATGNYSDGNTADLTATATWQSSDPSVATVDGSGLATGLALGSTTISAARDGVTGLATLHVTAPVLVSLAVTPATASVAAGFTQQFTATGNYSDGSTADLTATATWQSSDPSVATVDGSGLATGIAAGTATITATQDGQSASATLTVIAPVLQSITVSPASASVVVGQTQQFTATGNYSDGSTADLTASVMWKSSNTKVATITSGGLAKGVASGTVTITAGLGGKNGLKGTATLTVVAVNNPPIAKNDTASTRRNTSVTIKVLANDTDPDGDKLRVTAIAALPAQGTAAVNANNTITYTPAVGFQGTDAFQYQVSDGRGGTAVATVTVTVR